MHYLVYFARGLLLKGLRLVGAKSYKLGAYIVKHPIKSLWLVIKAYMALMLFTFLTIFFISSVKAQELFDRTPSYPPAESTVCLAVVGQAGNRPTMDTYLNEMVNINQRSTPCNGENLLCYDDYSQTFDEYDSETNCGGVVTATWTQKRYNTSNGEYYNIEQKGSTNSVNGYYDTESVCPPEDGSLNPNATYMYNGQCYDFQELEDNDTCEPDNPHLLGNASSPDLVCYSKPDGSKCAMKKYEVNGQFAYEQNLEPSACLSGENDLPPYVQQAYPPTGDECQNFGNGVYGCPADPSQVCDPVTGVCNTGCGTYDVGNGPQFICLADPDSSCNPVEQDCGETTDPTDPTDPIDPTDPTDPTDPDEPSENPTLDPSEITDPIVSEIQQTNDLIEGTNTQLQGMGSTLTAIKNEQGETNGLLNQIKNEIQDTGSPANFNDPSALYEPNDYNQKNFGTVMASAVERMNQAPITRAVDDFFEVSLSGTCPVYSTSVPYIGAEIVIDQFCGEVMNSIWPIISAIIILVFSVLAFRVAVL